MSKQVTFGMVWQCCGRQTVELPDDIDAHDKDAVREYLESIWSEIPLPDGDYVEDSDTVDNLVDFSVTGDPYEPRVYINALEGLPAAIDRNIKVEWTDIGEGLSGDYDPDNPEDISLLRFDVYVVRDGQWSEVDDASYCTQMPAGTDVETLKRAAAYLAKKYADVLTDDPDTSVKKLGERLSWISPDWFQENAAKVGTNKKCD